MSKSSEYYNIIVESYLPENTSGLHGKVHVRPLSGQSPFTPDMHVECSKDLKNPKLYEVGTRFKIKAKLTDREGGKPFVYSYHGWDYTVVE